MGLGLNIFHGLRVMARCAGALPARAGRPPEGEGRTGGAQRGRLACAEGVPEGAYVRIGTATCPGLPAQDEIVKVAKPDCYWQPDYSKWNNYAAGASHKLRSGCRSGCTRSWTRWRPRGPPASPAPPAQARWPRSGRSWPCARPTPQPCASRCRLLPHVTMPRLSTASLVLCSIPVWPQLWERGAPPVSGDVRCTPGPAQHVALGA